MTTENEISIAGFVIEKLCSQEGNILYEIKNMPVEAFTTLKDFDGLKLSNYEKNRILNAMTLAPCQMFFLVERGIAEQYKTTEERLMEFLLSYFRQETASKWWKSPRV